MNENKVVNVITLTDDKELREQYISKVEVLDKVKKLFLLPHLELMTVVQVAEYYEVPIETIKSQYKKNRDEFELDGAIKHSIKDINSLIGGLSTNLKTTNYRGRMEVELDENTKLVIPNVGIILFPKRAVFRMGMLLRDSEIAKEVRTQLLNITERVIKEEPEKATEEIENEQKYLDDIMTAYKSGDPAQVLAATSAYTSYQQRHIAELKKSNDDLNKKNEVLTEYNNILSGNILEWSNRASANKVVRLMAQLLGWNFGHCWNEIYKELLYRHNINLKSRHTKGGKKKSVPLLAYLHEDEWADLYRTIAAMLNTRYINPSKIFEQAKLT